MQALEAEATPSEQQPPPGGMGPTIDFVFYVPEAGGRGRRGRGRNHEIANFNLKGESGGIF
jgi:hypothetical protein|eukprot:COSAG01_NODE_11255_length_1971_cov_3.190171_3_plen_61_part_00